MKLELIATATFGLEAVVKREIEALGYKIIKSEDGKVTFMGDEHGYTDRGDQKPGGQLCRSLVALAADSVAR